MDLSVGTAVQKREAARGSGDKPATAYGEHQVLADDAVLDDLFVFVAQYPRVEVRWTTIYQFDATGGRFRVLVLKAKDGLTTLAKALLSFAGQRKCRIRVKVEAREVFVEGASAEEVERLLRVAHTLFIQPPDVGQGRPD